MPRPHQYEPEYQRPVDRAPLGNWWDRKNRGRSQAITRDAVVTLVEIVGSDDMSTEMTISCQLRSVDPAQPPNAIPPVVGELRWGNDGTSTVAEFDFVNGTTINVAASAVSLKARFEDPAEEATVVPAAHIGYMPHGGLRAVRSFRMSLGLFGAVPPTIINIPPFARSVTVERTGVVSLAIAILDHTGISIAETATVAPTPRLIIPNSGRQLAVLNLSDVEVSEAVAIFELYI